MGIYLGKIEKISTNQSVFFNFEPIAKFQNAQVISLTHQEKEKLLPESEKRNILLTYNWKDEQEYRYMDEFFSEKTLVLFEFDSADKDLEPNLRQDGSRRPTGYKVAARKKLNEGKIRSIGNFGVYFALRKDEIKSNFTNDTIVEIDSPCIVEDNQVFVEMDGFWAGPYEVGYREYTSSYYIKPQIKEQKYTVSGYENSQINQFVLNYEENYGTEISWLLLCPKQDAKPEQIDLITDSVLLESFKESIKGEMTAGGLVKLEDIPALLEQYEQSEIMGSGLTEETRSSRLNRLVKVMSSEKDMDETLHNITDLFCDLLVKYKDSQKVEEWLQKLLEKNPHLLDQLQSSQVISKHISELEGKLEDLTEQQSALEREIEESRHRAEMIDQQAVEAKKKVLLEQEKEYAELSSRIEDAKKLLGIVGEIGELQDRYKTLEDDVERISVHKDFLSRETKGLELQFQQLLTRSHEKMVEIAFDGFMASKMFRAAAEWEAEQTRNQYSNLINKVASIPLSNKTPEELIEYLCRMVRIRRPNYTKNTIVNIAICLTQGFLTVFSGEPGCGKTSVCNIFGEVLGLNKIADIIDCTEKDKEIVNRYTVVAVEKGWTSKRDFIGYYNPLSKSFDRSNRRIYDALHQLDTEKRAGILKLPYMILLDEANLSPMEYYWSDFMNICDDLSPDSKVNLGEDYIFGIPETLHFAATINNDYTVQALSPRLIDRAWVITLPQLTLRDYGMLNNEESIPKEEIEVVSWSSLREAFTPAKSACVFTPEIQKCYELIIAKLREKKLSVSPRIDLAIKRYWAVASRYFEMDDTKTAPATVALDYAVAQRILPKIAGNGEDFEKWLEEFRSLCSNNGLNTSAVMLKDIIERGNQKMKYYQFFC